MREQRKCTELCVGVDDDQLRSYGLGLEERPNWVMLWCLCHGSVEQEEVYKVFLR